MNRQILNYFLAPALRLQQHLSDDWAEEEHPEGHHAKGSHRRHKRHRDGQVDVTAQQQCPEVGARAPGAAAKHKETQSGG